MALVNKKTRKAIRKSVKKALRKHGPEIAAGLVTAVTSALATLATTVSPESNGRRSKLTELAREVSDRVVGDSSNGTAKKKSKERHAPERIAARRRSERDDLRGRGDDADDMQGRGDEFSGREEDEPGGRSESRSSEL